MANFKYKARDRFARPVSGSLVAEDKDAAVKALQDMGYVPISIDEFIDFAPQDILKKFKKVKLEEISSFTRQLYALQKAGLPLLSSLSAIAEQTKNKYFKTIIEEVARDIKGGVGLSDSLKKYGKVFDGVYISMIRAAEASGSLVMILERLAILIDGDIDTNNRIKASTRYPIISLAVLGVAFLIIVTFVIPRFAQVYSQFNAALPLPTRILIALNYFIQHYWYLAFLILGGAIFGFIKFIKSSLGRPIWDNIKLRIPVFGPLVTLLVMARFTRVTSLLMKSGVPILEVLDLSAKSSGNIIISRAIENIKESVNQGRGISEPMKVSGLFPPIVIQMISIGEQTGKVDELLLSVAEYYDLESGYMIKNLTTYIEPILIVILAGMVLLLALAVFLPMWNLIKVFKPA